VTITLSNCLVCRAGWPDQEVWCASIAFTIVSSSKGAELRQHREHRLRDGLPMPGTLCRRSFLTRQTGLCSIDWRRSAARELSISINTVSFH
jgi:hypothetical protein